MIDDPERCYRAVQSRDSRFDGWFVVGVVTTGIYCRPSCPAITPRRGNVRFFPAAAAAQQNGFRACKRCRPDASPGSPEWNGRADVVGRAMRLIADGVVDREGVPGLSRRLGYSERQIGRLITAELGAGPLAIARAQRAQTARLLVESSDVPFTDIAYAAGFGSVRQFNETVREVFGSTPTELRARRRRGATVTGPPGWMSLRLPARRPFDAASLFEFLRVRAVPGIESAQDGRYTRVLDLPNGPGVVRLRPEGADAVRAEVRVGDWRDIAPAVARCRRLLDLDADPVAIDAVLGADPLLAPMVAATPGRRAPATTSGAEIAVRGVVGQQVSVASACTIVGRLVRACGTPLPNACDGVTHAFPSPAALAEIDPALLPMPASRKRTLTALCSALAAGDVDLEPGAEPAEVTESLLRLPGIGPWTASYIVMRALGDPDVFLPTDLGLRNALARIGAPGVEAAARWRPWRTYAVHHLWASLAAAVPASTPTSKAGRTKETTTP